MKRLVSNPYLLLAFASLCWSGNHVIGRAIAGHVPPVTISTLRWLLPSFVLWWLARDHLRRDWPLIRRHWVVLLGLGLSGGALFSALQYTGLQYTSALNVSVLNSLTPVLIVAAGTVLFRDRLRAIQAAGISLSLAGVLVIVAHGSLATLMGVDFNWGDLIIVFNMSMFAVYAACLRLRPSIHWLSFLFVLAAVSAVGQMPFALWEAWSGYVLRPDLLTIAAIVYVSIFPSVLATAAWNRGDELVGAIRAGPFLHLIPIYTAILASTLLGETLAPYHVVGFLLILTGIWFAAVAPTRIGEARRAGGAELAKPEPAAGE